MPDVSTGAGYHEEGGSAGVVAGARAPGSGGSVGAGAGSGPPGHWARSVIQNEREIVKTVDRSVGAFVWRGVRVSIARPGQAWQFARSLRWQAAAARTRKTWQKRGVRVPPIIIFSITHQCNLSCAGCYAQAIQGGAEAAGCVNANPGVSGTPGRVVAARAGAALKPAELSDAKLSSIVAEATELGVSFFVVAGGEPLMRGEILAIAERFPRVLFLLFTNGLLLDDGMVERIARLKNIIPLLSLEGTAAQTDERRGDGTHAQLVAAMARMKERGQFFGCSLTLTSANFSTIFAEDYVKGLAAAGCRLFLFADYTPVEPGTESWVLTAAQREQVETHVRSLRSRYRAVFVAVPWDEREVGGCLSAGRGFIHINASGEVEPCPFAPYSNDDLNEVCLLEALRSPFLARLRDLPELFEYEGGGCELWENRERVEQALAEVRGTLG
jgi:MoaA/NifB/PqqE/SkfB family radical SAM enzyme